MEYVAANLAHPLLCHRLVRDPRAGYKQTLGVLEQAKRSVQGMVTKSSVMLGCGETDQQVLQTLKGELNTTQYYQESIISFAIIVCIFVWQILGIQVWTVLP